MKQQWNLFARGSGDKASRSRGVAFATLPFAILMSSCTSVPLKEGGTLTSYAQLSPAKGKFTKSRTFVDAAGLAGVKTVAIVPTTFSFAASSRVTSEGIVPLFRMRWIAPSAWRSAINTGSPPLASRRI